MNYNLQSSFELSLGSLYGGAESFLPALALAAVVLILGWIIGGMLGSVVRRALKKMHLDEALDKAGVDELSKKAGVTFAPSRFVGTLVKWFVILAFLIVSFDILGLNEVTAFMQNVVLGYLPQVIAAVLILFVAVIVAGIAGTALTAALRASGTKNPELFGKVARYIIIIFGIMATLNQLQIAEEMVQTLFMGIVFALSLALGLAFGLGGKESARGFIEHVTKK
jgi:hypothetical protein